MVLFTGNIKFFERYCEIVCRYFRCERKIGIILYIKSFLTMPVKYFELHSEPFVYLRGYYGANIGNFTKMKERQGKRTIGGQDENYYYRRSGFFGL